MRKIDIINDTMYLSDAPKAQTIGRIWSKITMYGHTLIGVGILFVTNLTYAAEASSIFEYIDKSGGKHGITNEKLRSGDIHLADIPPAILAITNNLLKMVGYISLFVILVASLMYVLAGTNENFKNKGKEGIKMALSGAIVSWSAWLIINFIIDNFI